MMSQTCSGRSTTKRKKQFNYPPPLLYLTLDLPFLIKWTSALQVEPCIVHMPNTSTYTDTDPVLLVGRKIIEESRIREDTRYLLSKEVTIWTLIPGNSTTPVIVIVIVILIVIFIVRAMVHVMWEVIGVGFTPVWVSLC